MQEFVRFSVFLSFSMEYLKKSSLFYKRLKWFTKQWTLYTKWLGPPELPFTDVDLTIISRKEFDRYTFLEHKFTVRLRIYFQKVSLYCVFYCGFFILCLVSSAAWPVMALSLFAGWFWNKAKSELVGVSCFKCWTFPGSHRCPFMVVWFMIVIITVSW